MKATGSTFAVSLIGFFSFGMKGWKIGRTDAFSVFQSSSLPVFRLVVPCVLCFVFSTSCSDTRYDGFTKTKNGLYYKLLDVGEGTHKAMPGDYVTAQISMRTENDSVLFDTRKIGLEGAITFILTDPEYEKDYREGFQYLSEGDSAEFLTDAYTLFIRKNHSQVPAGMNLETSVRVAAKILLIRTPEDHVKDVHEENKKLEQGEFEEKKTIEKFLADSNITSAPIANGMYYIRMREGKGVTPDSGRVALLNYRGFFLNGRCFDSNYETQPFEYTLGAEEQMLRGLELGIRRMHEGEKAKFIIPSHLAFGSNGSSNGMVPAFTTVIYEVELLKVQ